MLDSLVSLGRMMTSRAAMNDLKSQVEACTLFGRVVASFPMHRAGYC